MGLVTLNHHDFRDFERCPKIVSIKAYRELREPPKPRPKPQVGGITPNLKGKIAEVAFDEVFEDEDEDDFDQKAYERGVLRRLGSYGRDFDSTVSNLVRINVASLVKVRKLLVEEYGGLRILGRGQSRSGLLPTVGNFDSVAIPRTGPPVIIEIKSLDRGLTSAEAFQARFYNSLAANFGVMILSERVENGIPKFVPIALPETTAETILIHAGRGTYEVVGERAEIGPARVFDVWEAKQLGYLGKSPHATCSPDCPHHRFSTDLPEGTLSPDAPLPLKFAAMDLELGTDLDSVYLRNYLRWKFPVDFLWSLDSAIREAESVNRLDRADFALAYAADRLGIDAGYLFDLIDYRVSRFSRLKRNFEEPSAAWKALLGEKKLKVMQPKVLGLSRRLYSLPGQSTPFVNKCARAWHAS